MRGLLNSPFGLAGPFIAVLLNADPFTPAEGSTAGTTGLTEFTAASGAAVGEVAAGGVGDDVAGDFAGTLGTSSNGSTSGTTTEKAGDIDMTGWCCNFSATGDSNIAMEDPAPFAVIVCGIAGAGTERGCIGTAMEKILLSTALALAAAAGDALCVPFEMSRFRTREIRSWG